MSRHGYSDDCDNLAMWRGIIASATRGKRGQAFFRALLAALDAMPEKRLVSSEFEDGEGAVCALGCLGKARGLDLKGLDPDDVMNTADRLGKLFDIAPQLAQEVMFVNDEQWHLSKSETAAETRWRLVRDWAARQIRIEPDEVEDT